MKTALELPDWLMRAVKVRALRKNRRLEDEVADLLRRGLSAKGAAPRPLRRRVYDALLADDRIALRVEEPPGLEPEWMRFALRGTASAKLWMDAYLAAFAVAGACQLATTDAVFKQFRGRDLELLGG